MPTTPSKEPRFALRTIVLPLLIALSAIPYIHQLGFYSDDWGYEASLLQYQSGSVWSSFQFLVSSDGSVRVRPVQALDLALSFKAFGLNPLPYHIVGTLVLALTSVILYCILKDLEIGSGIALALAAVYGMLPHYSTDRFWIASQQADLCMLFALLGIYAIFHLTRPQATCKSCWGVLTAASFTLSLLSYEVSLGLIAATLGVASLRLLRAAPQATRDNATAKRWIAASTLLLLLVGIAKSAMQDRIVFHHHLLHFLGSLWKITAHALGQAVTFNLWSYGLHLPWVIVALWRQSTLDGTAVGVAVACGTLLTVALWADRGGKIWSAIANIKLIAIGFALHFLGIFLFARDTGFDLSLPGLNNRVVIASALGTASICVGVLGLISRFLTRHATVRWRVFSVLIGIVCALYSLVVSGIASYWVDSAMQQAQIGQIIKANVPPPPPGSVLLLDGYCRYDGPAPVMETDWDTSGFLQIFFNDFSIKGDVISKNAHFGETAVDTTEYGGAEGHYPYNKKLFVYNVRSHSLTAFDSPKAAANYLQAENPSQDSGCPTTQDGDGVKIY